MVKLVILIVYELWIDGVTELRIDRVIEAGLPSESLLKVTASEKKIGVENDDVGNDSGCRKKR